MVGSSSCGCDGEMLDDMDEFDMFESPSESPNDSEEDDDIAIDVEKIAAKLLINKANVNTSYRGGFQLQGSGFKLQTLNLSFQDEDSEA
ncbi:hypothetical protein RND71_019654 [Anisodus tanguticus]|uniref:Uncharacterized protein n=1 Tax=Anisodus tanguticus TaxID=243964 RepID=A0AAE1RZU8_9SOLA|nr:hypothetical protein RND71_019654 [Anisodus tanguticus]